MHYQSFSLKEADRIARNLVAIVIDRGAHNTRGAFVIGFTGDLGTGKTAFVRMFLKAMGVKKRVTSPTFVIMKRFTIPRKKKDKTYNPFVTAYHIDAYRIHRTSELKTINFHRIITNKENIVLIEWISQLKGAVPAHFVHVRIKYGVKENERHFFITGVPRLDSLPSLR